MTSIPGGYGTNGVRACQTTYKTADDVISFLETQFEPWKYNLSQLLGTLTFTEEQKDRVVALYATKFEALFHRSIKPVEIPMKRLLPLFTEIRKGLTPQSLGMRYEGYFYGDGLGCYGLIKNLQSTHLEISESSFSVGVQLLTNLFWSLWIFLFHPTELTGQHSDEQQLLKLGGICYGIAIQHLINPDSPPRFDSKARFTQASQIVGAELDRHTVDGSTATDFVHFAKPKKGTKFVQNLLEATISVEDMNESSLRGLTDGKCNGFVFLLNPPARSLDSVDGHAVSIDLEKLTYVDANQTKNEKPVVHHFLTEEALFSYVSTALYQYEYSYDLDNIVILGVKRKAPRST